MELNAQEVENKVIKVISKVNEVNKRAIVVKASTHASSKAKEDAQWA